MTTIRTLNDGAIPTHTPELDVAAAGFINGPELEIRPGENLLRLSPPSSNGIVPILAATKGGSTP